MRLVSITDVPSWFSKIAWMIRPLPSFIQRGFDWSIVLLGFGAGTFVIGLLANNEKPSGEWVAVVTMIVFGVVPLAASVVALRSRRRAAHLFFVGAGLAAIWLVGAWALVRLREGDAPISSLLLFLAIDAIIFAVPGTFWLLTDRRHWPALTKRSLTPQLRILLGISFLSVLLAGVVATGLYATARMPEFGDCGEPRPFAAPRSPEHVALIARIVYVHHQSDYTGWAIARTQHRYWGLPWWNQRFIVLPYIFFKPGEEYLIDGYVRPSLIGHLTNLMQVHCSRTAPVRDAQVDLRLLRDGPPKKGVRIIGRVLRSQPGGDIQPASHVAVTLMEAAGPQIQVLTDEQGIYDAPGLPLGHYDVRVDSCMSSGAYQYGCTCGQPSEEKVEPGNVWGCTLRLPSPAGTKPQQ
jgi:hypothetical protein